MARNIEQKKISLRKKYLCLRDGFAKDYVCSKSKQIVDNILKFYNFVKAKNVLLYYPHRNEVNILSLIQKSTGKKFYFPVVDFKNKKLIIKYAGRNVSKKTFYKNKFGILEPKKTKVLKNERLLDIIFVPGIVFDKRCFRIGFGCGYYDKYLSSTKSCSVGVCYEKQLLANVPNDIYDKKLDYVITEKRIIKRGEKK